MKKFLDLISQEMKDAFEKAGYDRELGKVTVSVLWQEPSFITRLRS